MMFNLHDFIFDNLVNGYKNGSFTKEQVSIYSVNYMTKGLFTESDIEKINEVLSEEIADEIVTEDEVATEEIADEVAIEDVVEKTDEN